MSTIGNIRSTPRQNSNEFEKIVHPKGAIAIPGDIGIVQKESLLKNKQKHSQKRKSSVFDETAIGKKSVIELNSMVDKNIKHIEYLSECGKLTNNRESVLLEDIQNLSSVIQQKQSVASCNGVSEEPVTVSYKIYKYNSLSIVGQYNMWLLLYISFFMLTQSRLNLPICLNVQCSRSSVYVANTNS